MDRIFLDANVLFSAAYRAETGLSAFWELRGVVLSSSRYAIEEARLNLEEEGQRRRLRKLAAKLEIYEAGEEKLPADVALPEKNRPILLAAMAVRATHLITGDARHFGAYFGKRIEGILVMTPAEYLRLRY